MPIKITCPFDLPSSHVIQEIGFRGDNKIEPELPFRRKDFLAVGTSLEIIRGGSDYRFIVVSESLKTNKEQVAYLEKAAEFISFIINIDEHNPHYGNNYVRINWCGFSAIQVDDAGQPLNNGIGISDSLSITSNRTVKLSDDLPLVGSYHDILRFYFDGLRAEHKKSKYFHWFLVIEFLEKSEKYKSMFGTKKLFSECDEQQLRALANGMDFNVKKSAILGLLSRTKDSRIEKLVLILADLGITSLSSFGKSEPISASTIKDVVDGRNALFHSGTSFPEEVLWRNLFPLVTLVAERVSREPICIES
ncbi:hypothetical protein KEM63_06335 [Halopseudomonas nanhaiensis]|uniref:hypothetical protein n=1 Tax=Halopseudomonas nanhaiensis TaxID=2830842 RepID=UPI001CBDE4FE|nr:hypothetical protein [Halopseudomonas nanhaiensis]UAW99580.1 hypothetical protein KEM63_06335 [Halopseudomonas nanhaiensis]